MASEKLFMPPSLKTMDVFEEWLYETKIWQCLNDLDKKKLQFIFLWMINLGKGVQMFK